MDSILQAFAKVTTLFFDIDGVLSDGTVLVPETGEQIRRFNIKDGYAINRAVKEGLNIIIISAGQNEGVRKRLEYLGVKEVNLAVPNKKELMQSYLDKLNLSWEEVLYMGDDIPDYEVMCQVGIPVCPNDAAQDILALSKYVSPFNGGQGAVRDVLEKILKIQGKWPVKHASGVHN